MSLQVCLQMFQLLSRQIAALVWDKQHRDSTVQTILQALLEIILGKVFSSHICFTNADLCSYSDQCVLSHRAATGTLVFWQGLL